MADERLRIVIDALNKASGEFKKVAGEVTDLDDSVKKSDKSSKSFSDTWAMTLLGINQGIQIIQQVGQAMEAAFDFTREGAQIIQTEAAFGSMADTIGMSTGVLSEWSDAVNGTVSDMQLMTGFQTLAAGLSKDMTAAFADNNTQLLKIAKAASALNPALGDTAFMYESITRGIKRSSPLILDNLGIVVKVGEANEALAKQLGKTVDELTAEEKQMALLNEVLKSGDRLVEQLGGTVESAIDPWDRFAAAMKNNKDAIKANIAGFEGIQNAISGAADAMEEIYTVTELVSKATEYGVITNTEYNEIIMAGRRGKEVDIELIEDLTNRIIEYEAVLYNAQNGLIEFEGGVIRTSIPIQTQSSDLTDASESVDGYASSIDEAKVMSEEAFGTMFSMAKSFSEILGKVEDKQKDIETLLSIKSSGGYFNGVWMSAKQVQDMIIELEGEIGVLEERMRTAAQNMVMDMILAGTDFATATAEEIAGVLSIAESMGLITSDALNAVGSEISGVLGDVGEDATGMAAVILGAIDQINAKKLENKSATYKVNWDINDPFALSDSVDLEKYRYKGKGQNATGGNVSAGNPYMWQEYGYRGEVMVPSADGFVLSRADAKSILSEAAQGGGGNGGTTFNLTANYEYKSPLSLTEEIRLLEAAYV